MGDTAELVIEADGPALVPAPAAVQRAAAPGHPAVRAGRAGPVLRSGRRRGPAQPRLRVRDEGARLAAARLRRPLFPSSGRGRRHPDRLQAGQRLDRDRAAARHGRGHRRHARRDRGPVRAHRGPTGRRRHQAQPARAAVGAYRPGGELPQAAAGDVRGHPRAAGQARRPAAQHAHAAFHQEPGQAPAHRRRDHGDLRAAGRADRHGGAQGRARGSGLRRTAPRRARERAAPAAPSAPGRRRPGRPDRRRADPGPAHGRHRGRDRRAREDALLDLAQDGAQERQLRAALRHHGVPRPCRRRAPTATPRWA